MDLLMKNFRSTTVVLRDESPATISVPAAFGEQLSSLYALVQHSRFVFGSPLGPLEMPDRQLHVPRFVYFGPDASDAALRLSLTAGFDHRDLRPTFALLRIIECLALQSHLGQGANLSIFPLIDVLGLAQMRTDRKLWDENWSRSRSPEIILLERDARLRAYHGFIRFESAFDDDVVTIRLRAATPEENVAPALEFISSHDFESLAVRWETDATPYFEHGPLSIADDLPLRPFELTVRIPASWPLDRYANAAASILQGFVQRFRAFFSYAQNL
jgi:hypothetical protein